MGGFLQANWFWIVLLGLFIWMHSSGMGCGGHGGHGGHSGHDHGKDRDQDDENEPRRGNEMKEHQH